MAKSSGNGKTPGNSRKGSNGNGADNEKGRAAADAGVGAGNDDRQRATEMPPEVARRIARVRSQLREAFGTVAMAMMLLPRYRHQSLADLQHLLLEPLLNDRIAIAHRAAGEGDDQVETPPLQSDVAGIAIWASVSEEVDARIREQIKARTFPIRLKPDEWNSGDINWLFDIIAPDRKTATNIVVNFKQVVKGGEVRLHPILGELLDKDILDKLRQRPEDRGTGGQDIDTDDAGDGDATKDGTA